MFLQMLYIFILGCEMISRRFGICVWTFQYFVVGVSFLLCPLSLHLSGLIWHQLVIHISHLDILYPAGYYNQATGIVESPIPTVSGEIVCLLFD